MTDKKLGLSAPWVTYQGLVATLFKDDADITVSYLDEDEKTFTVSCSNPDKYMLLSKYLKPSATFGNVTVTVKLEYTGTDPIKRGIADDMKKLFAGNPILEDVMEADTPFGDMVYLLFTRNAVGFYNDDLSNPWGNTNFLACDVAKAVLNPMTSVSLTTNNPAPACDCCCDK